MHHWFWFNYEMGVERSSSFLYLLFSILLLFFFAIRQATGIFCYECVHLEGHTNDSCITLNEKQTRANCSAYKFNQFEDDVEYHDHAEGEAIEFNFCETATATVDGKRAFHRACSPGPLNDGAFAEYVDDGVATDGSKIMGLHVEYCNETNYCNNGTVSTGNSIFYCKHHRYRCHFYELIFVVFMICLNSQF